MSVTYRVAEQFVSINGEGTRAGELAVFVRLCGCNLQCSYCDTQWANQPDVSYQLQTTEEIIQAFPCNRLQQSSLVRFLQWTISCHPVGWNIRCVWKICSCCNRRIL